MRRDLNKGASTLEGVLVLVVLVVIVFLTPRDGTGTGGSWNWTPGTTLMSVSTSSYSSVAPPTGTAPGTSLTTSSYRDTIFVGSGNAASTYQPYEEYITIEHSGDSPINITGWQLKNGKDKRPYYLGNVLQRYSADVALIPQATVYLPASGSPVMQDIVLSPREKVVVTTGFPSVNSPYRITNFKENICTGYIESLPEYAFRPSLSYNCPYPAEEPGIEALDVKCRNIVRSLPSCTTPVFERRDREGNPCDTCLNGEILASHCAAFIKEHFSYKGCLAYHSADPKFFGNTWRVFLGRGWEMWASEYETIELYDRLGQLVNFQNY